jgi:Homeodomain-like domain-containing protein
MSAIPNEIPAPRVAPLPRPRVDARTVRSRARIERWGRKLVWLAGHGGDPDEVVALARRLQPHLLRLAVARMREEGYPLPEYLVMGRALEQAILAGQAKPTTRFLALFEAGIDVAIEYLRLHGMLVDRFVLRARGASARQQARTAAIVEAVLRFPKRERRAVFLWLKDRWEPQAIAAALGLTRDQVRRILARAVRDARPRVEPWLEAWRRAPKPRGRARRVR